MFHPFTYHQFIYILPNRVRRVACVSPIVRRASWYTRSLHHNQVFFSSYLLWSNFIFLCLLKSQAMTKLYSLKFSWDIVVWIISSYPKICFGTDQIVLAIYYEKQRPPNFSLSLLFSSVFYSFSTLEDFNCWCENQLSRLGPSGRINTWRCIGNSWKPFQ